MGLNGRKKRQKISILSFLLIIVLLCGAMLTASLAGKKENMYLSPGEKLYLEDGWTARTDGKTVPVSSFPFELQADSGNFVNTLPEDIRDGDMFVFENSYQNVEIRIDGRQVYQYGQDAASPHFMTGKIQCFVELKPEYAGQQIEVRLFLDTIGSAVVFQPGYIATSSELAGEIIKDDAWACLFCVAVGAFAVFLLLAAFSQWIKKSKKSCLICLYLGLFALFSVVWVFTDSNLPQLAFANSQIIRILSFEAFMLMPVPLLSVIRQICKYGQKRLAVMKEIFLADFVIQNILYLLKAADFMQMIIVTHVIMLVSVIMLVVCLLKECTTRHAYYARWMLAGISILGCLGCASMAPFYRNGGGSREQYFVIGFLVFMIIMALLARRKFQEYSETSARAVVLEELAYVDMMTGMGNRTLYEQQLVKYDCVSEETRSVSVLLFDVDDLKEVNDTYGHKAGDKLVTDAARCIRQVYGSRGECYRIGGDEFVVILWDEEIDPQTCRIELDKRIQICNTSRSVPMSISAGCSVRCAGNGKKLKVSRMIELADERMYEEKRRYHENKQASLA